MKIDMKIDNLCVAYLFSPELSNNFIKPNLQHFLKGPNYIIYKLLSFISLSYLPSLRFNGQKTAREKDVNCLVAYLSRCLSYYSCLLPIRPSLLESAELVEVPPLCCLSQGRACTPNGPQEAGTSRCFLCEHQE